jgi:hypothetical protein
MYIFHSKQNDQGRRVTVAGIQSQSKKELSIGIAVCSPADNFDRKRGVVIASGRAKIKPHTIITSQLENPGRISAEEFIHIASELAEKELASFN